MVERELLPTVLKQVFRLHPDTDSPPRSRAANSPCLRIINLTISARNSVSPSVSSLSKAFAFREPWRPPF